MEGYSEHSASQGPSSPGGWQVIPNRTQRGQHRGRASQRNQLPPQQQQHQRGGYQQQSHQHGQVQRGRGRGRGTDNGRGRGGRGRGAQQTPFQQHLAEPAVTADCIENERPGHVTPPVFDAPQEQQQHQGLSPQKWQAQQGPSEDRRRRPPPRLHVAEDSKALQSWRNNEPYAQSVRIPEELVLQKQSNGAEPFYIAISREENSFIFTQHDKGTGGSMSFGIWGEEEATSATRRKILALVEGWQGPQKSRRAAMFGRNVSLTPARRVRAENKWAQEVTRQRFRQRPAQHALFGAIGTFHWPVQLYRPEEVLGTSFEALDPIRMDYECYIIFDSERSAFLVHGKAMGVQQALVRIRKTCYQIAARQLSPARLYLLHWADVSKLPSHVVLTPYKSAAVPSGGTEGRPAAMNSPFATGTKDAYDEPQEATRISENRIRAVMLRSFPKLHYYRGQIQVRIRLGRFLATLFKKPKDDAYTFEDYRHMITESQFTGEVTQEVGDKDIERYALETLQSARHFLDPSVVTVSELTEVRPLYSVAFTFADEAGDLRLEICWEEAKDTSYKSTEYDVVYKKWTRLDRDTGTTASIVDIALKDLTSGLAWQFDIKAAQVMEESRLSAKLKAFAESIRINPSEASKMNLDKLLVTHKPPHGVQLKSIQQKLVYRYNIKWSDFTLELAQFQDRKFSHQSSSALSSNMPTTIYDPRWSLSLYRGDWDKMLASNENLPIGERTEWEDDIDNWLPEDMTPTSDPDHKGAGFDQLMEKLKTLQNVMKDSKDTEVGGGMTVG
ncbi:uncharacterized protein LTR77_006567 [Saxophila tyrrhenica]|uniref:DUF7905 domain-containing protein n=1 Tax=Saxophila tyrrhenica TaxID=1690608 RepID=A0AAV9P8M7_9PEZI|nr:hypothetical protein LTR77_006567 [Saxophila tyrrhenica]